MKTSIVILTFNQLTHTINCIDSIRKYTDKETYEIIVVDNNSTDGTVEWLKKQEDIKVILNNENLGFPKGCNQGMAISQGDNILFLNNDVIVTPNWLSNLNICLYSSNYIGAVGAVTNYASNYQSIPANYKTTEEMIAFSEKNNVSNENQWEEKLKLIGFCLLIKKEVIEKVGFLDERFSPGNFEDDDYSFRIRKAGYKLMLCKDAFVHHVGSASFGENQRQLNNLLYLNKKKLLDKWGFNKLYYAGIYNELVNLINEPLLRKINVLEIGCSCGATLLKIKNIYKNAHLFGIDSDKEALEITKTFAEACCMNIENENLPYEEGFFDYILFGNVLEHLYDPLKWLKNIRKYLKNDGEILGIIPNVMHYSIIKNLLNGTWNQSSEFLEIPLRFFTLNEIGAMFKQSDYLVKTITGSTTIRTEEDQQLIHSLNSIIGKNLTSQYQINCYFVKARNTQISIDEKTRIKFLLRRIENDILVKDSKNILAEMIYDARLNLETVLEQMSLNIIKKEKVLNQLALQFSKKGIYDYAKFFLSKSYEINNQNSETQRLLEAIEGENSC